jgi:hypothetical protein
MHKLRICLVHNLFVINIFLVRQWGASVLPEKKKKAADLIILSPLYEMDWYNRTWKYLVGISLGKTSTCE